jgi:hypothetical protein
VAQEVEHLECLSSEREALSSNPSTATKTKQTENQVNKQSLECWNSFVDQLSFCRSGSSEVWWDSTRLQPRICGTAVTWDFTREGDTATRTHRLLEDSDPCRVSWDLRLLVGSPPLSWASPLLTGSSWFHLGEPRGKERQGE